MNIQAKINHRFEVSQLAILDNCKQFKTPKLAIDVNNWGISEAYSDCENNTIYRNTLFELSNDTFTSDDEEADFTHYPDAPYGSIWDY